MGGKKKTKFQKKGGNHELGATRGTSRKHPITSKKRGGQINMVMKVSSEMWLNAGKSREQENPYGEEPALKRRKADEWKIVRALVEGKTTFLWGGFGGKMKKSKTKTWGVKRVKAVKGGKQTTEGGKRRESNRSAN